MGKYLDIARKFEAERKGNRADDSASQQQSPTLADYHSLYAETAELVRENCLLIDPAWLLAHSRFYEQIRGLDDQLTTMERLGASEQEYRTTLVRLVALIQDAQATQAQEQPRRSAAQ